MYMLNRFPQHLAALALMSLAIVSCQKETAPASNDAAGSPNTKTTASLTIGPPTIVWWGNCPAIPFTDNIPGDVPISNQFPLGFAINGKGYVCGDVLTTSWITGDHVGDLWQFDPATVSWTKKSSFPGGDLVYAFSFVIGDNAYVVTGNTTWQYNQPTDKWTQKAYIFSAPRLNGTAFAINGKGYMGLGYDPDSGNDQEQNDWWQYDPVADRWLQKSTFPGGKRQGAPGFAIDGKGYVVSGTHYANGHGNWGNKVWQYDPVADTWTQKNDFPGPGRWDAVGANGTIGGNDFGFIAGGDDDGVTSNGFNDVWEYNPRTDSWGQLPNILGGARTEAAGFVLNRSLFIANISVSVLNWSN
jgi:N-acetylneuraminic acid mutarotase